MISCDDASETMWTNLVVNIAQYSLKFWKLNQNSGLFVLSLLKTSVAKTHLKRTIEKGLKCDFPISGRQWTLGNHLRPMKQSQIRLYWSWEEVKATRNTKGQLVLMTSSQFTLFYGYRFPSIFPRITFLKNLESANTTTVILG